MHYNPSENTGPPRSFCCDKFEELYCAGPIFLSRLKSFWHLRDKQNYHLLIKQKNTFFGD